MPICVFLYKEVGPDNPIELVWTHWTEHYVNKTQNSDENYRVLPNALIYATTEFCFIPISLFIQVITASKREGRKYEDI